jgi:hypothetical protein
MLPGRHKSGSGHRRMRKIVYRRTRMFPQLLKIALVPARMCFQSSIPACHMRSFGISHTLQSTHFITVLCHPVPPVCPLRQVNIGGFRTLPHHGIPRVVSGRRALGEPIRAMDISNYRQCRLAMGPLIAKMKICIAQCFPRPATARTSRQG